ncbi:MAG: phospholipid carrier-dependent glycosyltransferase, partial [Candidatus Sumerlaeia bacterium]|nr:phospholipid carrier-dependent glycosyltransferase [Candidatus Sumerlaeia bacterium]
MKNIYLLFIILVFGGIYITLLPVVSSTETTETRLSVSYFSPLNALIVVINIFLLGFLIGRVLWTFWQVKIPIWCINLFSLSFGLGVLSLLTQGIGLLFGFYKKHFLLMYWLLLVCVYVLWKWVTKCKNPAEYLEDIHKKQTGTRVFSWTKLLLIILPGILMLEYFQLALLPPVAYDVLEYHLAAPVEFIRTHSFAIYPHLFYVHLPLNMEMLYTLGILYENVVDALSPKLINFGFLLLIVIGVYYVIRESGLAWGWAVTGIILLLVNNIILRSARDAFNDLAVSLWVSTALACWYFWTKQPGKFPGWLFLAGIFIGLGIGVKYPVIYLYLIPFLLILLPAGIRLKIAEYRAGCSSLSLSDTSITGEFIKSYLLFITGVVFAFLPWAVKNWLINHNPVYPFLSFLFTSPSWTVAQEKFYLTTFNPVAPWEIEYWRGVLRRTGSIGVLYIVPSLLAFVVSGNNIFNRWRIKVLVLFSILAYLIWNLWEHSADRYLSGIVPLLVIIVIYVVSQLQQRLSMGKIITVLFYLAIAMQTVNLFVHRSFFSSWSYAITSEGRKEFRKLVLGELDNAITYVNEKVPKTSKVMLIYEARPYYLLRPVVVNSVFDQSPLLDCLNTIAREKGSKEITVQDLVNKLIAEGITHCLVNEYELIRLIDFFTPEEEKGKYIFSRKLLPMPEIIYPLYPPWLFSREFPQYSLLIGEFLRKLKQNAEFIPAEA